MATNCTPAVTGQKRPQTPVNNDSSPSKRPRLEPEDNIQRDLAAFIFNPHASLKFTFTSSGTSGINYNVGGDFISHINIDGADSETGAHFLVSLALSF